MLHASTRVYGNFSPMGRAFGCGSRCWEEPQGPALGETSVTRISVYHSAARLVPPVRLFFLRRPVATLPGMARMGRILAPSVASHNLKSLKKMGA